MAHDVFDCECHETCSWCTTPVLEVTLLPTPDGARVCQDCRDEVTRALVLGGRS